MSSLLCLLIGNGLLFDACTHSNQLCRPIELCHFRASSFNSRWIWDKRASFDVLQFEARRSHCVITCDSEQSSFPENFGCQSLIFGGNVGLFTGRWLEDCTSIKELRISDKGNAFVEGAPTFCCGKFAASGGVLVYLAEVYPPPLVGCLCWGWKVLDCEKFGAIDGVSACLADEYPPAPVFGICWVKKLLFRDIFGRSLQVFGLVLLCCAFE